MGSRPGRVKRLITIAAGLLIGVSATGLGTAFAQDDDIRNERPPGEGPTRIAISFYLMDLMRVINTDEAFEADLFALVRWHDTRLVGGKRRVVPLDQVWTPNLLVFNKRSTDTDLPETVEILPDGTVTYRQRLTGTFASPLDLRPFPMDSQTLAIRVVVYGASPEEVVLEESSQFPAALAPGLSLAEWKIGELTAEASDFNVTPGGPAISSLTLSLDVERRLGYYIVQMLIPLILIVGMTWVVFWIDPSIVPARTSVPVTAMLTLIAYRFMIGGLVPKLSYLTRIDYFLLGSTLLVALALVVVATGTHFMHEGRPEISARLNRVSRVVFPSVFVGFLMVLTFAS